MLTKLAGLVRALVARGDAFFFGRDLTPWSALRIGTALNVLGVHIMAGISGNYERFYSTFGGLSRWEAVDAVRWPAFLFLARADAAWIWWIYAAMCAAATCLALGLWTRPAAVATCLLYAAHIQRNTSTFNGESGLLSFLLFGLIFAPRVQAFSLDHRWRRLALPAHPEPWPARYIQVNVCAVYLFTTIAKLVGKWDVGPGEIWYATTIAEWFRFRDWDWLRAPWVCALAINSSLLLEGSFAFLVWTRLRVPLLFALIGLHVGILILFRPALLFFNLTAIVALFVFFKTDELTRWWSAWCQGERPWRRHPQPPAAVPVGDSASA